MPTVALTRDQVELCYRALREHDGNKTTAAESLGMSVGAFRNRIRRGAQLYGLEVAAEQSDDRVRYPVLPDGDIPIEDVIDSMSRRFERRHDLAKAKRWMDIEVPVSGPFCVVWVGDPHLDSNGCNWPLLREHIELMRANRDICYAFSVGDCLDNWPKSGRLTALYAQADTSEDTAWRLAEWFLEKSDVNWLGWLLGNHDLWNDASRVFKNLGAKQVWMEDWGARFKLVPPTGEPFRVWASHNFPGHSQWNSLHGAGKAAAMKEEADVYVAGHTHNWALHTEENASRGFVYDIVRARGYKYLDDHADRLGFDSQAFGASVVTVFNPAAERADERLQTFRNLRLGIEFCRYLRGSQ